MNLAQCADCSPSWSLAKGEVVFTGVRARPSFTASQWAAQPISTSSIRIAEGVNFDLKLVVSNSF